MLDFLNWRILKRHTSPGSLVYAGPDRSFAPSLCEYAYGPESFSENCLTATPAPSQDTTRTLLLHISGVHDPDIISRAGQWLSIHPLILEDIMNSGQRPKFSLDDDAVFMVFKDVELSANDGSATQHHIGLYWHKNIVLAFQDHEKNPWNNVINRIRQGKGRIRSAGPAYLVIAMIDALIDAYYSVLGELNNRAEIIEEKMSEKQSESDLMELYSIKREVVLLRSTFLAAKDNLDKLATQDVSPISETDKPYLADVRDHAQQVVDTATTLHDILSDMLNVQISLAGMRMNNVMKVLTIIATIFIPLTFIAGIYGMNFPNMPELRWEYGYPAVWAVMIGLFALLIWFFKRKDWF